MVVETSRQPVDTLTTAGPGHTAITWRTLIGAPQPAQSLCPPVSLSGLFAISLGLANWDHPSLTLR